MARLADMPLTSPLEQLYRRLPYISVEHWRETEIQFLYFLIPLANAQSLFLKNENFPGLTFLMGSSKRAK